MASLSRCEIFDTRGGAGNERLQFRTTSQTMAGAIVRQVGLVISRHALITFEMRTNRIPKFVSPQSSYASLLVECEQPHNLVGKLRCPFVDLPDTPRFGLSQILVQF